MPTRLRGALVVASIVSACVAGRSMPERGSTRPSFHTRRDASGGVPFMDGVDGVLAAFDSAPIVALADIHGAVELGAFRNRLIRDKRFAALVHDVVIEAGNSLYQPVADRFVDGHAVPYDSVRLIWNNTTQSPFNTLDEPLYAESILDAVRAVNQALPAGRKVRVLLADPPIEWRNVRTRADFQSRLGARTASHVAVLRDSVLAKGHRALFIVGSRHVFRRRGDLVTPPLRANATESLLQLRPKSVFVIGIHDGLGGGAPREEPLLNALPRESYIPVRGSFLEKLSAEQVFSATAETPADAGPRIFNLGGGGMTGPSVYAGLTLADVMDGYLFLAPMTELTVAPADRSRYRSDPLLLAELDRRQRVISGQGFDTTAFFAPLTSPFLFGRWRADKNARVPASR